MSHINESRKPGGIGYPTLQDHGWQQRGVRLEDRASVISVRIKDRKFDSTEFGEYVEDPETRGDWACWLYWDRQSNQDRAIGSWSPVFPAVVPVRLEGDEPPDGAPPLPPAVTDPGDRFVRTQITDQNGLTAVQFYTTPDDPPQTRYDMVPEPPLPGQTYDFNRAKARPVGKDNAADTRYEEKDVADTPWGNVPGGTVVAVVGATVEDEQREVVLHCDPRLVAAHRGGPPTLSTAVHDLGPRGDINESRSAPLHSIFRVVPRAAGALSLGLGSDVISWNIGRSGQNDTIGGLVTDQGGLQTRHALMSVRDGGPIDVGSRNDVHYLGTDADGNPINMAHFSTSALFRGHGGDGPLHIKEEFPNALNERGPWKQRVHCGFDKYVEYQLPRDQPQFTFYGKFSWWTENLVGVENPPPGPPTTPSGDDPPPPTTPPEIPPPTTPGPTPGPTTPGGGPGTPTGGGGGPGPGTPGGGVPGPSTGGGGVGGGPTTPTGPLGPGPFPLPGPDAPPPLFPGNPPIPNPADRPGFSYNTITTYHSGMSQDLNGRDTKASTHMEFSATGFSGRAPLVQDGGHNIAADPTPTEGQFEAWRSSSPTTWRMLTYGAQEGSGTDPDPMAGDAAAHKYTQRPGSSRSEGGTASGGLAFLPPEVNLTDYATDYSPPDVSPSTAHFTFGPNTKLAFGKPDMGTGGVRTGHTVEGETGDLVFDRVDSSGAASETARMTAEGAVHFADLASDPTTPSNASAVYSKGGELYHRNASGTVSQITPPTSGVTDHGALTGLTDIADHPGYLDLGGTRAMTGGLDMGTNDIDNVTTIYTAQTWVSTNTTLTNANHTVFVDAGTADVTITLPTGTAKKRFIIKKTSVANSVFIKAATGEYFDQGSYLELNYVGYESVMVQFYDGKWRVLFRDQFDTLIYGFPIFMAVDGLGSISADGYAGFGRSSWQSIGDDRYRTVAPIDGTIHTMRVTLSGSAITGGDSWTFTLYKNGSSTGLSCTISAGQLTGEDLTTIIPVTAGDLLTVFCDETGTLTHDVAVTAIYEAAYQPMFGRGSGVGPNYGDVQNARDNTSGDVEAATVFPASGTLKNFYINSPNVDTSGEELTVKLRSYNAATGVWSDVQTFTLNFDSDGSSKSDLVTTVSVTAGTAYQWEFSDTGTGLGPGNSAISCVFVPDTAGTIILTGYAHQFASNPGYLAASGSEQDDSATSTDLQANIPVPRTGIAQNLYVVLQQQPTNATEYFKFEIMKNGSPTTLAVTVTNPDETGSDTSTTIEFTEDTDTIGMKVTDTNTAPNPTWAAWGFEYQI